LLLFLEVAKVLYTLSFFSLCLCSSFLFTQLLLQLTIRGDPRDGRDWNWIGGSDTIEAEVGF
jgi:hypothetical protein